MTEDRQQDVDAPEQDDPWVGSTPGANVHAAETRPLVMDPYRVQPPPADDAE